MAIFENFTWWTILDAFLIFTLVTFVLKFILKERYLIEGFLFLCLLGMIFGVSYLMNLPMSFYAYLVAITLSFLILLLMAAPSIRRSIEDFLKHITRDSNSIFMGNDNTRDEIITAVLNMAKTKTGALITIEKNQKLDRYAQNAVLVNADVTAQLLEQIFVPNTPLHDGAVIIRGNKIICASAYYELTSSEPGEKSTGARHRAALGITEISDSFTIVVSEETGKISMAYNRIRTPITEDQLKENLRLFFEGRV